MPDPNDLHDGLHHQIRGAVDLEGASLDMDDVRRRAGRHRRNQRVVAGGAVMCALLLVAGAVLATRDGGTDPDRQQVYAEKDRTPSAGWTELPDGPLSPRTNPLMAWTGKEVLVIGGRGKDTCPRNADCSSTAALFRDGAAYDPAEREWRSIADAPADTSIGQESVTVDGDVFVFGREVCGRGCGSESTEELLRYDPDADRWSVVRSHPGAPEIGRRLMAWDDKVVAYVSTHERGLAPDLVYDPAQDAWSQLPDGAPEPLFDRRLIEVGDSLVAVGIPIGDQRDCCRTRGVYRPAVLDGDTWRTLPDSSFGGANGLDAWVAHGDDLINVTAGYAGGGSPDGENLDEPFGAVLHVELDGGTWSELPQPGKDAPATTPWPYSMVSGSGLAIDRGRVLDLDRLTWRTMDLPEGAPESFSKVWAGDRLVIWGGDTWHGNDPDSQELSDRGWEWIPPAPQTTSTTAAATATTGKPVPGVTTTEPRSETTTSAAVEPTTTVTVTPAAETTTTKPRTSVTMRPAGDGSAEVSVTGAFDGSGTGGSLVCDAPDMGWPTEMWTGDLGGNPATLQVSSEIEGDLDGIILKVGGKEYRYLEHNLRTVDEDGTIHVVTDLTEKDDSSVVHLVATLHCP